MGRVLSREELKALSERTLAHYDEAALAFEQGTRDHDVSQNRAALLNAIEGAPPFVILDLGCGPGRDLAYFRAQGHIAVGLDGSKRFVEMARAATGCEVLEQNFLALELSPARFHGVFANASLFTSPVKSSGACLPQSIRRCCHAACCSAPTREVTTRKASRRAGTAPFTRSKPGAPTSPRRASARLLIIIVHRAGRFRSSPGSLPYGAKTKLNADPVAGGSQNREKPRQ